MTATLEEKKSQLIIGSIVSSVCFANGYLYNENARLIIVDGISQKYFCTREATHIETALYFDETGEILPDVIEVNLMKYDLSRALAQFVIVSIDCDSNGTYAEAYRLDEVGNCTLHSERIRFYITGTSVPIITMQDIAIIGEYAKPLPHIEAGDGLSDHLF